jgi:hypothetical protein
MRAGIEKRLTWHISTTYSTMLVANGESVKVIQETYACEWLLHIEVYSQARTADKRAAQQRLSCK